MTRVLAPVAGLVGRLAPLPTLPLPDPGRAFVMVGRSRRCDVVLDDASVSRDHAGLVLFGGQWFVWDHHSTNGTRVNGRRIWGTAAVRHGDEIAFGEVVFRLTRPAVQREDDR